MMFIAITRGIRKYEEAREFARKQKRFSPDVVILFEEVANGLGRKMRMYHVARPARRDDRSLPQEWKMNAGEDNILFC